MTPESEQRFQQILWDVTSRPRDSTARDILAMEERAGKLRRLGRASRHLRSLTSEHGGAFSEDCAACREFDSALAECEQSNDLE